jgi:hypothetical protein
VDNLLTGVTTTNEESWLPEWAAEKFTMSMELALTGEVPYLERLLHLLDIGGPVGIIVTPYAGMQYGSGGQDFPIEQWQPAGSCQPGAPGCDIPGPPAPVCDEECQCDQDPDCED